VNRRGLWSPHDVERHGLVRVAAEAADFKIGEASVEGVAKRLDRQAARVKPASVEGRFPRIAGLRTARFDVTRYHLASFFGRSGNPYFAVSASASVVYINSEIQASIAW
jgi:hypothetical protein